MMNIEQIQELGKIVNGLGATGKDAFMMYLAERIISTTMTCIIVAVIVACAYKLFNKIIAANYGNEKIARAYDGTHTLYSRDIEHICQILENSEEGRAEKAKGKSKDCMY